MPDIDKGLRDILQRWVYYTPVDPLKDDSDHLLGCSLDMARRKAWYDTLQRAYGKETPDTHVLTHFANWLTSDPNPMQLPSDLTTQINKNDFFNEGLARELLGSTEDLKTQFAADTLFHLLVAFIEQFEEISSSPQEVHTKAMESILEELRELAFEQADADDKNAFLELTRKQEQEAVDAAAELEKCHLAVEKARMEEKAHLVEYAKVQKTLAILRSSSVSLSPKSEINGKVLGKRRGVGDQDANIIKRRKLNSDGEEASYIGVRSEEEWPEIIRAQEQKIQRLESSLYRLFELEKEAGHMRRAYESLLVAQECARVTIKDEILGKRNWIKNCLEIKEEVEELSPKVAKKFSSYPTMTLSFEAALAILFRKGIIRSD